MAAKGIVYGKKNQRGTLATDSKMRVLIVESDDVVALTLQAMLVGLGHLGAIASTLPEAVAAAREDLFDAYVIDLGFPECGGPALLGSLRREEGHRAAARAIGWTGAAELWQRSPAAELFDAALAKPVSMRALMAVLHGDVCPDCSAPFDAKHLASLCHWPKVFC